ncbi:hypothetical protein DKY63_12740 [Pseudomonas putida]|uniref:Uncharacterized protein n=1 Tax=Pseudomonas putida TaxID=303 RepID=A0A2Z4RII0_PSEPU|nr:hypothetical protein DKY63_12740 [Pseudomonas putida]
MGASLLAMVCQSKHLCLIHHREQARSYSCFCAAITDLSIQSRLSKQMDIKVCLSFPVLYPCQAF